MCGLPVMAVGIALAVLVGIEVARLDFSLIKSIKKITTCYKWSAVANCRHVRSQAARFCRQRGGLWRAGITASRAPARRARLYRELRQHRRAALAFAAGLELGVCGTAAATRKTVLVPDVHKFPGHIACDVASKSEIVVPLVKNGRLLGVLDLDSPKLNRFDATDQAGLEKLAAVLVATLE